MKTINNNLRIFIILFITSLSITSCDPLIDDFQTDFGNGPVLTQFENTTAELNIIKDAANTPIDYEIPITYFGGNNEPLDRDVQVTIATSSNSEATEGVEFELISNTFTIPAGETTASIVKVFEINTNFPPSVATSSNSEATEGVEFELISNTFTIPAGETTALASIRILTGGLVPFDFKDIVLEITDSSESVSGVNTFSLTLKALDENTLAGTYVAVEGEYWNSGSFAGDFTGGTYVIAAISPGLYRHEGIAFWPTGNDFYFTVDEGTGLITVLDKDLEGNPTLLNGSPIMTCEGAGGPFEMIPCDDTVSVSTLDPDGHHEIKLTTGYHRGAGATREFFERLVRL